MNNELPPGWKVTHFKSVVAFSKKPSGLRYSDYHQLPFVPMEFLPIDSPFFGRYIPKDTKEITSGTYFEPGDVLVAKITPSFENGKQGIIENLPESFGVATTEVIPFREINNISNKLFLFYYLLGQSVRSELASKMEGSTGRQRLSKFALENLEIRLPLLPEQRAIARALRAVQGAREARLREVALERERKAALMEHLFTKGTRGEATKQTEIGEMPESWKIGKLEDFIKFKSGESRPENMVSKSEANKKVPVYGGNGIMGYTNNIFSEKKHLIIGRVGEYCGCVHISETPNWITDNALYSEKWLDNRFEFDFAAYYLSYLNLNQFKRKAGQPLLTQGALKEIKIILPSNEEQNMIATISKSYDSKIGALDHEARLLEELFRAMLEELMSGRLPAGSLVEPEG